LEPEEHGRGGSGRCASGQPVRNNDGGEEAGSGDFFSEKRIRELTKAFVIFQLALVWTNQRLENSLSIASGELLYRSYRLQLVQKNTKQHVTIAERM
jgi:hypothetical protein